MNALMVIAGVLLGVSMLLALVGGLMLLFMDDIDRFDRIGKPGLAVGMVCLTLAMLLIMVDSAMEFLP